MWFPVTASALLLELAKSLRVAFEIPWVVACERFAFEWLLRLAVWL